MAQQTGPKAKITSIIGHAIVEHYALYNVKYADGGEDVKMESEIPEASKMLDRYKQKHDPQTLSANDVYVVEKILNHHKVGGKILFLVKWAGYEDPIWNTEMGREDLKNSELLVREYLLTLEKPKKKTPVKRGRGGQKAKKAAAAESSTSSDSDGPGPSNRLPRENGLMKNEKEEDSGAAERGGFEKEDEEEEGMGVEKEEDVVEPIVELADSDGEVMEEERFVENAENDDDGVEGMDEAPNFWAYAAAAAEHHLHQMQELQFRMEYADRFMREFGVAPQQYPQFNPEDRRPVALVPPQEGPIVEFPDDE